MKSEDCDAVKALSHEQLKVVHLAEKMAQVSLLMTGMSTAAIRTALSVYERDYDGADYTAHHAVTQAALRTMGSSPPDKRIDAVEFAKLFEGMKPKERIKALAAISPFFSISIAGTPVDYMTTAEDWTFHDNGGAEICVDVRGNNERDVNA